MQFFLLLWSVCLRNIYEEVPLWKIAGLELVCQKLKLFRCIIQKILHLHLSSRINLSIIRHNHQKVFHGYIYAAISSIAMQLLFSYDQNAWKIPVVVSCYWSCSPVVFRDSFFTYSVGLKPSFTHVTWWFTVYWISLS